MNSIILNEFFDEFFDGMTGSNKLPNYSKPSLTVMEKVQKENTLLDILIPEVAKEDLEVKVVDESVIMISIKDKPRVLCKYKERYTYELSEPIKAVDATVKDGVLSLVVTPYRKQNKTIQVVLK